MQMILLFFCCFSIGMYIFLQFISFDGSAIYIKDFNPSFMIFALSFILFITGMHLSGIKIALLLNGNQKTNVSMLFSCFNFIFLYLIGQIIVYIPLLLIELSLNINLFIFRLMISFVFAFYPFIIIDQQINNPIIGLRTSFIMTINNLNITAPLFFILVFANITVGLLTIFLGFIILLPLSILCYTKCYLLLKKGYIE